MGVCMKDHPAEDILDKLEDVGEFLDKKTIDKIIHGLEVHKWEQPTLNEIFHALKKLEKKISEEEKTEVLDWLQNFL